LILYDRSGGSPGELLATIYIEENGEQSVYEVFDDRHIMIPIEEVTRPTISGYIRSIGIEISRSEMREIRRLLNRVLANEQGSLGLVDSEPHVTIRQGENAIQFTRGMADIRQSDELINRVQELIYSERY